MIGFKLHPNEVAENERKRLLAETAARIRQGEWEGELDREVDRQLAEEATTPEPSGETTEQRFARLEREAAASAAAQAAQGRPPTVLPAGALMRQDAIRRRRMDREAAALEQREEALGLPALRAKWDAKVKAITDTRDETIRRAQEVCRTHEQGARDAANLELHDLGARPTLADLEAVAA